MKQCEFKRFDFNRKPNRQWHILRPITWALSYPTVWKHRTKIEKIDMDNLKPPYILLCNHNAFLTSKLQLQLFSQNEQTILLQSMDSLRGNGC